MPLPHDDDEAGLAHVLTAVDNARFEPVIAIDVIERGVQGSGCGVRRENIAVRMAQSDGAYDPTSARHKDT
ncbi:hypothetical protein [Streptomyces sp. NRRL S-1448]|uniref:hypothetical protein n=1 Tax=Streptomyces sp. NRRL S-1448 TaxID=1463883 RepID=UPI0004BF1ED8|nr:hypothetical protein [Streptomyces sp. NRRL S-1448]